MDAHFVLIERIESPGSTFPSVGDSPDFQSGKSDTRTESLWGMESYNIADLEISRDSASSTPPQKLAYEW